MSQQQWIFYTDSPPLLEGGHGNHGIAVQILKSIGEQFICVLTRKFRRSISRTTIRNASAGTRLVLHPDVSGYGIKKFFPLLGSILDFLVFGIWIIFSKNSFCKEKNWFILCSANYWFLLHVLLLQKLRIATHIYLVDEIEASAEYNQPKWFRFLVRPTLSLVLRNSCSVFAISEGFVGFLKNEYGCNAHWLPLPSQNPPISPAIPVSNNGPIRSIVFIGGLNYLYLSALKDLYEAIAEFNAKSTCMSPWKLEVLSYNSPEALLSLLPDQDHLIFYQNLSSQERIVRMSQSAACFLPYSFCQSEKILVSTSFSCKILEYFISGSPMLVYGPAYASIPRYFIKNNLPVCTTNYSQLKEALHKLHLVRGSDYLAKYHTVWNKYHSPNAFKANFIKYTNPKFSEF